jgi:hypothetical protein
MSLSKLNARDDSDTKFPELDTFVSQIRCRQTMQISSMFKPTSKRPKFAVSKLPRTFHDSGEYKLFELAAVETWVEQHLQTCPGVNIQESDSCEALRRFMTEYHERACSTYENDPISMSIMYLTLLELWVACDKSACRVHPLLGNTAMSSTSWTARVLCYLSEVRWPV